MDPHRFDTLTRSLTATHSRRGALAAVLGSSLGLLGVAETVAKKGKGNGKGRKKGRKKEDKPYTLGLGQTCTSGRDCFNALCSNGTCVACALEADCGNAGCFCSQPPGGGARVCVSKQFTKGAISSCALCDADESCVAANPGTFDCFPRCGAG